MVRTGPVLVGAGEDWTDHQSSRSEVVQVLGRSGVCLFVVLLTMIHLGSLGGGEVVVGGGPTKVLPPS